MQGLVKNKFGFGIRRENAFLALPFFLRAFCLSRVRFIVLKTITLSRVSSNVLRQGKKHAASRTSVANFRMAKKEVTLVLCKIRLLLIAVRALPHCLQQTFLALARFHSFLMTRSSSMQNRFLGSDEVHRAKGTEVRRRSRVGRHNLGFSLVLGNVTGQLMTLKRDQRAHDLGAKIAFDTLLIHVRRSVTRSVTSLFGVQPQLEVVSELPIATAAG